MTLLVLSRDPAGLIQGPCWSYPGTLLVLSRNPAGLIQGPCWSYPGTLLVLSRDPVVSGFGEGLLTATMEDDKFLLHDTSWWTMFARLNAVHTAGPLAVRC